MSEAAGQEQTDAWNEATDAIDRNPLYHGLKLELQLGLVPLGEDPESHLLPVLGMGDGRSAMKPPSTGRSRARPG